MISSAPPTPSAIPTIPPSNPCASDSPVTCRTTSACPQPSAFSVPSSRTRFVTDESVSSEAIRNAATSPTISSAVPSLLVRFLASTSEPEICFARSPAVVTDAPLNCDLIAAATLETCEALVART